NPTIRQLQSEGLLYRGVLFIGLMIVNDEPYVLEYNVRFGDPETQTLLPLLDGDWAQVFTQVAHGDLPEVRWKPMATACVVLAAAGYPEAPRKGIEIDGDIDYQSPSSYFLHAG